MGAYTKVVALAAITLVIGVLHVQGQQHPDGKILSITGDKTVSQNVNSFDEIFNNMVPSDGPGFNKGFFGIDSNYYYALLTNSILGVGPFNSAGAFPTFGQDPKSSYCCGNRRSSAFAVCREDTSPPKLTCPKDVTVETVIEAGQILPQASDAECGISRVSTSHTFVVGSNVVTYVAEDNSGNTASCTFNVEIAGNRCVTPAANTITNTNPIQWVAGASANAPAMTWTTIATANTWVMTYEDVSVSPSVVHYFGFNIPVAILGSTAAIAQAAAVGVNDFGTQAFVGFGNRASGAITHPLRATHNYRFKVWGSTRAVQADCGNACPSKESWFEQFSATVVGSCEATYAFTSVA